MKMQRTVRIASLVALIGYVLVIDGFWPTVIGGLLLGLAFHLDQFADELKGRDPCKTCGGSGIDPDCSGEREMAGG